MSEQLREAEAEYRKMESERDDLAEQCDGLARERDEWMNLALGGKPTHWNKSTGTTAGFWCHYYDPNGRHTKDPNKVTCIECLRKAVERISTERDIYLDKMPKGGAL